jgi:hypothetical protein
MKTLLPKLIAIVSAIFVLGIVNAVFPVLRFSDGLANEAAILFILTIPLIVIALSFFIPNKRVKTVMIVPLLPVAVSCIIGQFFLWPRSATGYRQFDPISTVAVNGTQVVAYRTDGGATTDFGIVVRQQRRLMPGLLIVRNLYSEYHAYDARLEVAGPAAVRVIMDRADGELTFPVRRFVWL